MLFVAFVGLLYADLTLNSKPKQMGNPFFSEWTTQFEVPPFDKIKVEHYKPAYERAMTEHLADIEAICNSSEMPTFENTIMAYDNAGELLTRVAATFGSVSSADTNEQMQRVKAEMSPILSAHYDKVLMNDTLFERVKAVYDNSSALDADQKRLTEKIYRQFVRSGALLSDTQKERLKEINSEMSVARVKFASNLLEANRQFTLEVTKDDLKGLPSGVQGAAKEKATQMGLKDTYVFTLSKPSMLPFLTYSDRADLREKLYKGYLERCNYGDSLDNKQLINTLMKLRTERVHLLGFESHADYVLDNNMAKTPSAVYGLLNELWTPSLERAKDELEEMKVLKVQSGDSTAFASWDWWYYAEKLRKSKYALDEEMLRPYFSLNNVRDGIFYLSNRLYGITFRPVTLPVYNKECVTYEVLDENNEHLGVLYMDMHPRDGKSVGAWCGSYRSQSYKDGKRVAPIVTIVCNFTRPSGSTPSLLTLDEVETYFHEFGHALHSLFADVKYRGLRGVERDFVELPSQIMENWAMEAEMLKKYALHHRTNTPIPDDLIRKIHNSSLFNQGFVTTELLAASLSDMDIHTIKDYKDMDINAFEKRQLFDKRGLIHEIEPRYRYPYFKHIFDGGYASGYYSYIWAEVLDKDAYEAFVESGDIFNKEIAARFRKLLASGGSKDGMDLYLEFRGAKPSQKPLLLARGLIEPDVQAGVPAQPDGDVDKIEL